MHRAPPLPRHWSAFPDLPESDALRSGCVVAVLAQRAHRTSPLALQLVCSRVARLSTVCTRMTEACWWNVLALGRVHSGREQVHLVHPSTTPSVLMQRRPLSLGACMHSRVPRCSGAAAAAAATAADDALAAAIAAATARTRACLHARMDARTHAQHPVDASSLGPPAALTLSPEMAHTRQRAREQGLLA